MSLVDTTAFQRAEYAVGEDEDDTRLLHAMFSKALAYLQSHEWAPAIDQAWLAYGVGKVIALFFFEFVELVAGTDSCLWIVVGDLPSAEEYIDWFITRAETHSLGPSIVIGHGFKGELALLRGESLRRALIVNRDGEFRGRAPSQ